MIINKISGEEKVYLDKKFKAFDTLLENKKVALGYIKNDPSLFAYYFFTNRERKRFKVLPWQDKFLNSKAHKKLMACSRQVGKSTTSAIDALHRAYWNDEYVVLIVSRTRPQAKELVYKMKTFLKTSRYINYLMPTGKESMFEVIIKNPNKKTESRILVVPATDAALGYSADYVIGDEAARWENGDYIFHEVIEPTTAWTKGDISLLSTPEGKIGFFWECFNSEYWECYNFDYTVNPYFSEKEIQEKRDTLTVDAFARQYEAKFVASEAAYFNYRDINRAVNKELGFETPTIGKSYCIGVDFGKINDKCVIHIGTIENPESPSHEQIVLLVKRIVKPLGTDYATIMAELKDLNLKYNYPRFVLDATGVGEAPSDILSKQGIKTEAVKFSIRSKLDIFSNLKILFEQSRIKIPKEKELIDQLQLFEYEYTVSNQMKLHHPEGGHDDECDALALMAWGFSLYKSCGAVLIQPQKVSEIKDKPKTHLCGKCDEYFQAVAEKHFSLKICPKCEDS